MALAVLVRLGDLHRVGRVLHAISSPPRDGAQRPDVVGLTAESTARRTALWWQPTAVAPRPLGLTRSTTGPHNPINTTENAERRIQVQNASFEIAVHPGRRHRHEERRDNPARGRLCRGESRQPHPRARSGTVGGTDAAVAGEPHHRDETTLGTTSAVTPGEGPGPADARDVRVAGTSHRKNRGRRSTIAATARHRARSRRPREAASRQAETRRPRFSNRLVLCLGLDTIPKPCRLAQCYSPATFHPTRRSPHTLTGSVRIHSVFARRPSG